MSAQQPPPRQPSAYEELQTFSAVLNHIRVNYMDSVTYTQLVRAAIDGVLQALDPHSRFESYADRTKAAKLQRGELAVTGLVLENVDGVASVLAVMLKSPADKAGLQPGDRLTFVEDTTVAAWMRGRSSSSWPATRDPRFTCASSAAHASSPTRFRSRSNGNTSRFHRSRSCGSPILRRVRAPR